MTLVACIGGGQLGRMLALAGLPLGLAFRFLDPSADAPAGELGELIVGAYDDPEALGQLAAGAAVVTYEFENVPVDAVRSLAPLPPPLALELGQDRLVEKRLFQRLGIPTGRFGSLAESGLPAIVKSRRLGYDGKGQRRVSLDEELGEHELAEEIVPFDRELSIIAVRSRSGETRFWPLAENGHRDGILRISQSPAVAAPQAEAEELAGRLLDELDYVGVLALELFEVNGRLLANEYAPRVHNTGHWTIDGAVTSQFENHLRAILGLPLGSTDALAPTVMLNLIGAAPASEKLLELPGAHLHLYGKSPRRGRKIGHVTLVGTSEGAVAAAAALVDGSADG
jgi:5-(carboxyamino)imidazole ribonucleotide synthase